MKDRIRDQVFDLNELLHPADAFEHPSEVVHRVNAHTTTSRSFQLYRKKRASQ